jgi:hypothetical protein
LSASASGLRSAARGSALVFPGLALLLVLSYALWLAHGLDFAGASPFVKEWYLTLPAVALVLVQLGGQALCLGAARATGGRRLLLAAMALNAVAVGMGPLALLPETPGCVELLLLLASLLAQIPFLLFLRGAAHDGGFGDLEARAERVAVLWAALVCLPGLVLLAWQVIWLLTGHALRDRLRLDLLLGGMVAWAVVVVLMLAFPLLVLVRYGNLTVDLLQAARRHAEVEAEKGRLREEGWVEPGD